MLARSKKIVSDHKVNNERQKIEKRLKGQSVIAREMHPAVAELIESGKDRGFITYDELNTLLPDELVEPDRLDELLVTFDTMDIRLVDVRGAHKAMAANPKKAAAVEEEATTETLTPAQAKKKAKAAKAKLDKLIDMPDLEGGAVVDMGDEVVDEEEVKRDLAQAISEAATRRIDDPVRMYLTQMGEISLLSVTKKFVWPRKSKPRA